MAVNGTTTVRPQGLSLNIKSSLGCSECEVYRAGWKFCMSFLCFYDKNAHILEGDQSHLEAQRKPFLLPLHELYGISVFLMQETPSNSLSGRADT